MGTGIAQVSAQSGFNVTLVDSNERALEKSSKAIQGSLRKWAEKQDPPDMDHLQTVLGRLRYTSAEDDTSLRNADLVIEAIVEQLDAKHALLKRLDAKSPPHTLLATNTSSFSVHEVARVVSPERQKLVAGLHFFNPVPHMKLVEIISTSQTDQLVTEILTAFCKTLGKVPVHCKDTPGFIVNRLLVPYMMEAVRLAERGDATIQDIDTAMKLGASYPMGPFELADFVGLDTLQHIIKGWYASAEGLKGSELAKPSKMVEDLVQQGKLGRKSGAGFYDYSKTSKM